MYPTFGHLKLLIESPGEIIGDYEAMKIRQDRNCPVVVQPDAMAQANSLDSFPRKPAIERRNGSGASY
jgi:hypothetical protein